MLYEAEDVLAAFEIKNHGTFGKGSSSCDEIRLRFQKIQAACPKIWCVYITLSERETFKNKITTENLGFDAYTLFWDPKGKEPQYRPTGHWMQFINELNRQIS
jgi:hypothetical protein